jgi:hypothetical protein
MDSSELAFKEKRKRNYRLCAAINVPVKKIQLAVTEHKMLSVPLGMGNRKRFCIAHKSFKILRPKRLLVVGRRWNFVNDEWRAIASDFPTLSIHVVAQFYN